MSAELVERKVDSLPVATTPLATYHELVAGGADPEKLRALLELQRDWERDEAKKIFAKAKVACKSKLPIVVKDKQGDKGLYASLEHVSRQIDPIATEHGFVHDFGTKSSEKPNCVTVTLSVQHEAGHHEERELVDVPLDTAGPQGKANKTPVQGLVSSVSYAQRKLKLMYWDVTVADEDRDGDAPGKFISEEQEMRLRDALDNRVVDMARFYKWLGIDDVSQLPVSRFDEVMDFVVRKPVR